MVLSVYSPRTQWSVHLLHQNLRFKLSKLLLKPKQTLWIASLAVKGRGGVSYVKYKTTWSESHINIYSLPVKKNETWSFWLLLFLKLHLSPGTHAEGVFEFITPSAAHYISNNCCPLLFVVSSQWGFLLYWVFHNNYEVGDMWMVCCLPVELLHFTFGSSSAE